MKKIILILLCTTLTALTSQARVFSSDEEVLTYTEQEIKIVQSEIQTLKLKQKVDKTNQTFISLLEVKNRELKNLKEAQKYIKSTIKLKANTIKAFTKYEKLQKQLDSNSKQMEGIKLMLSSFDN